jgi:hypothetical protein
MAEDETTSALHVLYVRSPIRLSAAVIVLDFLCIARPASLIIIAMNHYTFSRYFYYDPPMMAILFRTELMLT